MLARRRIDASVVATPGEPAIPVLITVVVEPPNRTLH
jgi:hypothetical protein